MTDPLVYVPLLLITILIVGLLVVGFLSRRSRILRRIGVRDNDFVERSDRGHLDPEGSALRRWLYLAGYRSASAEMVFLAIQVLFILIAVGTAFICTATGVFTDLAYGVISRRSSFRS